LRAWGRIAGAGALLAARRGDAGHAVARVGAAMAAPVGCYHHALACATGAEAHLALGRWADAVAAVAAVEAEGVSPASATRLAMVGTVAAGEGTLDARARRERVEVSVAGEELVAAVDAVALLGDRTPVEEAELAHARAALTLLAEPDAGAWAAAAAAWERAGDPWAAAVAQTHEAATAARRGAASQA